MDREKDASDFRLDPGHARKVAAILSIQPDDSQPLTQFSREQLEAYLWAVKWLHDFNLGRMPEPGFSDEVLGRLSDFHGTQMNAYFQQREPAAPELTDSLAEWSQRALAGMKRMATDPEYRASIGKRIS